MKIRKQVYELTTEDLTSHPVWEFALDEEGEEGQDEATVRPRQTSAALDPSDGMYIVRARFTLADGTTLTGYITPCANPADLGTVQPQIVTTNGQVGFWFGLAPTDIQQCYAKLGKTSQQVFPIAFAADIEISGGRFTGTIPAFLKLKDLKTRQIMELK